MDDASPPPSRAGVREPVRYSPELGRRICRRIAAGVSERVLEQEPGMPSRRCFHDWARRDPAFGLALDAAKRTARAARIAADRAADAPRLARRILSRAGRRGGSVSAYTEELGEAICARLAGGESVLSVAADPAMPCAVTIYNWARRIDGFREMYLRAKGVAADAMFDLAYEIALDATEATVRADRLRIQALRWRTAMLAPKKYGERLRLGPLTAEDDEPARPAGPTVIIQRFFDPPVGPQFTDGEGNPVPRPEGHYSPLPPGWEFEPVPEGQVGAWDQA